VARKQSKPSVSRYACLAAFFAGLMLVAGCSVSSSNSAPAVPTFTPTAGSYSAAQTVTISDATEGATLHCTTDGSTPTASSPACGEPTTVSKSLTLSAIAALPGGGSSGVATAAYTINLPAAAAPVISPAAGTYMAAQMVTISDSTAGASIYYTADGSTPTTASNAYSGPITVSASETITAIAVAPGYDDSALASAAFTINLPAPAPVITPAGGTFTGAQAVTITDPIAGATIYYTVTPAGNTPTTPTASSTVYSGPVMVTASATVSAIAIASGYSLSPVTMASFDLVTATPVISPSGGTFTSLQNVAITDATFGAAIFYTVTPNGSTPMAPTIASTPYTGPIQVSSSETIEAIAIATGLDPSATATAAFTVSLPPAAAPVISPAGGTFGAAQTVTLTDTTPAAAIYYTVDGSTPSATHGTLYTGPISVAATETVQAVAVASGYTTSPVAAASFTINLPPAATPVITPAGGTFDPSAEPTVSITDITPGASIYYTIDGSLPTVTNGIPYGGPFLVTTTEVVKAIAIATGYSASAAASQTYIINQPTAATPVFSLTAGTYTSAQSVTISEATSGVAVYYTLDGSTPSALHGTLYNGTAIAVSSTETLKAIAIGSGYNNSPIATAVYTINLPASPTPVISPGTGTYSVAQTVSITDQFGDATIYYTTDGSTPTPTNGTMYTGTFTVGATETVNAIAVAPNFGNSAVATATFTFIAATPSISPDGGMFTTSEQVTINDTTPGVTIYYTITPGATGTTPTTASTVYTAPFTITAADTVEAYAVETGFTDSAVATASFTLHAGAGLFGNVVSGSSPVTGATVQLYAAGTGGYGTGATGVGAPATTDGSGSFSITYNCPAAPGDQMYVVATGGSTSGPSNTGLALMTALGSCSALPTSSITINEVTTIGSVYALSGFASMGSGGGIDVGAPAPSTTCLSTAVGNSSCNYPGLVNAFKTVNNLVSISGGTALTTTPAYGSSGSQLPYLNTSTAPQARVNTLADILSTCVDNAAGCATLFGDVGGANPADTIQAALDIARNPGNNVATLYSLVPVTPPYTPTLATTSTYGPGLSGSAAPVDFTLALTYTGGGLGVDPNNDSIDNLTNNAFALDASGNVWITATDPDSGNPNLPGCPTMCEDVGSSNLIAGFNNLGAPLTPATIYDAATGAMYVTQYGGYSASPIDRGVGPIVIDASNNLWLLGGDPPTYDSLFKVTVSPNVSGPPTLAVPTLPGTVNGDGESIAGGDATSLAFDQAGDLWASTNGQTFSEFGPTGALVNEYSNPNLQTDDGQTNFTFDANNSLWSFDAAALTSDLYSPALTTTAPSNNGPVTANPVLQFTGGSESGLAAGPAGTMYTCNATNSALLIFNSLTSQTGPISTFNVTPGCNSPVVDGDGNFWSLGSDSTDAPTLTEVNVSGILVTPGIGYTETSSAEAPTNLFGDGQMAIDGSGNLWLMNTHNFNPYLGTAGNVLVEVVGAAAPTITPLSVATQNGAQGTRP
jgi:hypothetical protein